MADQTQNRRHDFPMGKEKAVNQVDLAKSLSRTNTTKMVLLIMDGLGGLATGIGGLTELETARTPHLDALARTGMVGLMHPIGMGITPGSGPGHLGLFGYDPLRYVIGRGVLEAVGIGEKLTEKDVAARGNFCTVDENGVITDRRAGRISTQECTRMVEMIRDITLPGVEVIVKPVRDYRFALILRGEGLSPALNETDPQQVGLKPHEVVPLDQSESAKKTAELVNLWVSQVRQRIKDQKPANMVTLRGWAKEPGLPTFLEVYKLRAAALAVYPMYKGLAGLVGMTVMDGLNDLESQLACLEDNWDKFDFFFIHHKYTDSRGEDGDFQGKVAEIEKVDKVIPRILKLEPDVLVVTGDHSTPSALKSHSWHPVPLVFWAKQYIRFNPDVTGFGETQCLKGALGQFHATSLMPLIAAHALRLDKYGA
jgi:2,3-bisphosphoglycerate-independent phosphoglycerate mutase